MQLCTSDFADSKSLIKKINEFHDSLRQKWMLLAYRYKKFDILTYI